MATVEECEKALHVLAERTAAGDRSPGNGFDRTLSCRLRDLGVVFAGELDGGQLRDIHQLGDPAAAPKAQVALDMTSDDLLAMVEGRLKVASAWATGRIKIDARKLDLLRLRSIF